MTDALALYVTALQTAALAIGMLLVPCGVADLLVDAIDWLRRGWRARTVYRGRERPDASALSVAPEKPFAILVPAWQEAGAVAAMLARTSASLDYEPYHVFVATYPNDPETQRAVDEACARFPRVHRVVCARPGPTSRASALNEALDAALRFERHVNQPFSGFVLHTAGDAVPAQELRLFNYLVPRKDLIQVPVYPVRRPWTHLSSGAWLDALADRQGREIPMRETLAGQVPSAGAGTCLSRRAILALLEDGDGVAFDLQSVAEDYDIPIRLRARGMTQAFVRFPAPASAESARHDADTAVPPAVHGGDAHHPICVQQFAPATFRAAVRRKSRLVAARAVRAFAAPGIRARAPDVFVWRDRAAVVAGFAMLAAAVVLALGAPAVMFRLLQRPSSVPSMDVPALAAPLLWTLGAVLVSRVVHRVYFVWAFYGAAEGLLSVPRLLWGAAIDTAAHARALAGLVRHAAAPRAAWDERTEEFPVLGERVRTRRPLGRILVEQGAITEAQLDSALAAIPRGLRLGSALVHAGTVTPERLAAAVADQCGVAWEPLASLDLRRDLLRELPEELALRYAVVPVREDGATLVVGSESYVDPVSLAAMARKLDRPVRYVIVPKGCVTVGLRHWYVARGPADPRRHLQQAARAGRISEPQAEGLWREYVSRQLLFADILMALGHLDAAALQSVLLRHERRMLPLGDTLILNGIVSPAAVEEALDLQQALQISMEQLLTRAGISPVPVHATAAEALARRRAV